MIRFCGSCIILLGESLLLSQTAGKGLKAADADVAFEEGCKGSWVMLKTVIFLLRKPREAHESSRSSRGKNPLLP